jgi:hypothetical protein
MEKALQEKVIQFLEQCHAWEGCMLEVREAISTHKDNFDRHFTTFGLSAFLLRRASWRISGGRIIFDGEHGYYEIGADLLLAFDALANNEFQFIEKYGDQCYRQSILKFR